MPHFSIVELISLLVAIATLAVIWVALRATLAKLPAPQKPTGRSHAAVYTFKKVSKRACFWLGAFLGAAFDVPYAWNILFGPTYQGQSTLDVVPALAHLFRYGFANAFLFAFLALFLNLLLRRIGGFPFYFEITRESMPVPPEKPELGMMPLAPPLLPTPEDAPGRWREPNETDPRFR